MASNPLRELSRLGQSVWLDNLARPLIDSGELDRLIRDDGISGITSNPAIFHKAMTSGDAYDRRIAALAADGKRAHEIYEALAIGDIRDAADCLRPVFDRTSGDDGYVSLEVSPHLARDTGGTVAEAQRLWEWVDRPNLLIKIPGTVEGIPAVEECLARGININITLLFSLDVYRDVIEAFFTGLERRRDAGQTLDSVASVASFFLSRIDVKVDKILDARLDNKDQAEEARALRGRTAIANAKIAYRMWQEMFDGERWKTLATAGARLQRPLWASTSTKDPTASDVKYVEALIGPHTVNTLPNETVDAFRDHGRAAVTLDRDLADERKVFERLARIDVNIARVTDELVVEGIDKFVKPFEALIADLDTKRHALAGDTA